jgi:hypothetical protein
VEDDRERTGKADEGGQASHEQALNGEIFEHGGGDSEGDERLKSHGASQASEVQVQFSRKMAVSFSKSLAEYIVLETNRA